MGGWSAGNGWYRGTCFPPYVDRDDGRWGAGCLLPESLVLQGEFVDDLGVVLAQLLDVAAVLQGGYGSVGMPALSSV